MNQSCLNRRRAEVMAIEDPPNLNFEFLVGFLSGFSFCLVLVFDKICG
jgi:hypothetical protein